MLAAPRASLALGLTRLRAPSPVVGTPSRNPPAMCASEMPSVDVSDLGLTMDDLEEPLPPELTQGIATSGYESTQRLVSDDGCVWAETPELLEVALSIPGLRGQPAMAMAAEVTSTSMTVTAFGRDVWSCVLRGQCVPDSAEFSAEDGPGALPVLRLSLAKANPGERWGGFIASIGEDSIL